MVSNKNTKKEKKKVDKKVLNFFLFMSLSVAIGLIDNLWIQVFLLIYQGILIGQFLESYFNQ